MAEEADHEMVAGYEDLYLGVWHGDLEEGYRLAGGRKP
jgi:hypothetical protein